MELLYRIERFLKRSGISASRFGREAAHDPRLVHDLRKGREPREPMSARVGAFIDRAEQELTR